MTDMTEEDETMGGSVPGKRPPRRWIILGLAILAILAFAGVAVAVGIHVAEADQQAKALAVKKAAAVAEAKRQHDYAFSIAITRCGSYEGDGFDVADSQHTLTIDMKGNDDSLGVSYQEEECVLKKLHIPTAVIEEMEQTRALDGRQEDSWDNYRISWRYHPDSGLDSIVRMTD